MLASGLGLIVLLVLDLRDSVAAQDARALEVAQRDAERGARELQAALRLPEVLERVPEELRFAITDGELLVPANVGWLEAPPAFEPQLDAAARDHLVRASRMLGPQARELWQAFLTDPTLRGPARAWATLRVAWFAQREGEALWRAELLAALDEQISKLPQAPPAELGASLLLLCAGAELSAPSWAQLSLPRLPRARSEALLARLEELGRTVDQERRACELASEQRAVLRSAQPFVTLLAAAQATQQRACGEALLLFFPERGEGAWLEARELEGLIGSLTSRGLAGAPPVSLGGQLAREGVGVPVIEGLVSIAPEPVLGASLTSGPAGLALLAFSLATICGGGVFLALRSARREAETAKLRSEFVTGVTHELKTPLAGIRLTADLLADGHVRDTAKQHDYLVRLGGEAQRLGALIDNVLDLGRLERGERGLALERAELVELVRETLALFEPLAVRSRVELVFEPATETLHALVDRDGLRQALLNVLDNARKYGGEGQRIEVTLTREQESVCLAVRDFGPGVPAVERELIFERFRRGAQHRDGKLPGVGLGLYLARELLRRQGGELVCSAPPTDSTGARFELRLPLLDQEGLQ